MINKNIFNELLEVGEEITTREGITYVKFAEGKIARVIHLESEIESEIKRRV